MEPLVCREVTAAELIDSGLARDIEALETATMSPILAAAGIHPDPERLRSGLRKPQELVALYRGNQLVALLRWSLAADRNAHVWSIQIASPVSNRSLLRPLLRRAAARLHAAGVDKVRSVALRSNTASIAMHARLGFTPGAEGPMGVELEASFADLARRILRLCPAVSA